jgi:hypothetical protein
LRATQATRYLPTIIVIISTIKTCNKSIILIFVILNHRVPLCSSVLRDTCGVEGIIVLVRRFSIADGLLLSLKEKGVS